MAMLAMLKADRDREGGRAAKRLDAGKKKNSEFLCFKKMY